MRGGAVRAFTRRWSRRLVSVLAVAPAALVASAALVALAGPAAAHVAVDEAAPNGDGTTTVTLAWNHSCSSDAATTGVRVAAGTGVEITGAATSLEGWTAVVDGGEARFSGPGLPTDRLADVEVTVRITGLPGDRVLLPAVQECGTQRLAWTDPEPSSEHPAPSLIATAAILDDSSPSPSPTLSATGPGPSGPGPSGPGDGADAGRDTAVGVAAGADAGAGVGADLTQALGGVLALAFALAAVGVAAQRRAESRRRARRPTGRRQG